MIKTDLMIDMQHIYAKMIEDLSNKFKEKLEPLELERFRRIILMNDIFYGLTVQTICDYILNTKDKVKLENEELKDEEIVEYLAQGVKLARQYNKNKDMKLN